MAVLEKIRVKFGLVISIIIALALLSFIIDPSQLEAALNSMSSKNDVGVIAGKSISYPDYLENVEKFNTINEIVTGSSVQNENTQKQLRDAAWQELVDRYMFIRNAGDAGIVVGAKEMEELTVGENPSPMIASNPAFSGEDGSFDPAALSEFLQNVPSDQTGRLKLYWNYLYNGIRTNQYYSKYNHLFLASSAQNELQKARLMAQNNASANVDYVYVPYPAATDSSIVVRDSEIKQYYNDHKSRYSQVANRDIEYVVFEVVPSEEDVAAANEKFASAYEKFVSTDNVKSFLRDNSSRQLDNHWYKAGELKSVNSEISDFVDKNNSGTSPIVRDASENAFYAVRIMDVKPVSDSIYVKHILLPSSDRAKADSLAAVAAKGGDFSALAAQYSADQNSAVDGTLGNLGWMTQSYILPGFEGLITASVNVPQVIKTQYGLHVAVVSKKTAPIVKKQVAIYELDAVPSSKTYNKVYADANSFAALAGHTAEGFHKAVEETGQGAHRLTVTEATSDYGSVSQAKEVTRWIFDAKEGKASDRITVNNNYFFVVCVDKVRKEGFKAVSEVAPSIRQILYSDKLAQARKAAVAKDIEGLASLEEIAAKLNVSVENNSSLSLGTRTSRGDDPAFTGAVFAARENVGKVSAPVAGMFGTYVFRGNSVDNGSFFTEDDAAMAAQRLAMISAQGIMPVMSDNGVVKDNRARFF